MINARRRIVCLAIIRIGDGWKNGLRRILFVVMVWRKEFFVLLVLGWWIGCLLDVNSMRWLQTKDVCTVWHASIATKTLNCHLLILHWPLLVWLKWMLMFYNIHLRHYALFKKPTILYTNCYYIYTIYYYTNVTK